MRGKEALGARRWVGRVLDGLYGGGVGRDEWIGYFSELHCCEYSENSMGRVVWMVEKRM